MYLNKQLLVLFICSCNLHTLFAQDDIQWINELKEVVFLADAVTVNNDTLTYSVSRIASLTDKSVEDVLRRLPGIVIEASGLILYNNKPINHFYIEGIDLLGAGYSLASRNIRPEDIISIQILERHQPIKVMKGHLYSDRAAINIKLKKSRLERPIGYVQGGSGIEDNITANMMVHLMKIGKSNQQLIHYGSQYNGSIQLSNDVTNVGSEMGLIVDPGDRLFTTDIFSTPSFSKNRYINNRDVEATHNFVKKVSDNYQYKTNIAYSAERNSFMQDMKSILLSEDKSIEREETNSTVYHMQKAKINFECEKNSETLYVKHVSQLIFDKKNNDYKINTNYNGQTKENLSLPRFNYSNSTDVAIPIGEHRLQGNLEMSLNNRPKNKMRFLTAGDSVSAYEQSFDGTSFAINAKTAHQYSFDAYSNIGISLDIAFNYDDLHSLYNLQNGNNISENDINGSVFVGAAIPFYKLVRSREKLIIEIPIECRIATFSTKNTNSVNYKKFDVNYKISNIFKFNSLFYTEAQFRRYKNYGTVMDFFSQPFRTSYLNTTIFGNEYLTSKDYTTLSMSMIYRNPIDGHNIMFSVLYNNIKCGMLSNNLIGKTDDSTNIIEMKNTQNMVNASFMASKQSYDKQLLIRMTSNIVYSNRATLRSSIPYKLSALYSSLKLSADKTLLQNRMNIFSACGWEYSNTDIKSQNRNTEKSISVNNITLDNKVSYSPIKHWNLVAECNAQWNKSIGWTNDVYIQGGVKYAKTKHEFNLSLTNLLNKRTWKLNSISLADKKIYTIDLRPIGFNITYKYLL